MSPDGWVKQVGELLDVPVWPPTLKPMECYQRFEDDSPDGFIQIVIGGDGDCHLMAVAGEGRMGTQAPARFRMPMVGGGQSPRVRNAMLILAEAIRLDNLDHPQQRL